MSRLRLAPAALATAALLGLTGMLGAAPAQAADPAPSETEAPEGPPQEAVAIPYLGEASISAAAPWVVAGCAGDPLPGIAVACGPDGVTLAAPEFDPAWGEHPLVLLLDGPPGRLEVAYRVSLAPPDPPAVEPVVFGYPVPSGAQTLVPISLLGITCTLCTAATVEVGDLDPAAAGTAVVTGTHLALRLRPGFTGDAVLPVRVTDDAGQGADSELAVRVGPVPAEPFTGLHVVIDGVAPLDLRLLAVPGPVEGTAFRCSPAVLGTVACVDGVATYAAPEEGGGPDQFTVQLVRPDGRQALASVTVVPGTDGMLPAPAAGTRKAVLGVAVRIPENGEQGSVPALAGFADLLERTGGAR